MSSNEGECRAGGDRALAHAPPPDKTNPLRVYLHRYPGAAQAVRCMDTATGAHGHHVAVAS
eukprot:6199525-Pleurochrysis_carterae.AAC.13